jgi:elongation factor P
MPKACDVRRGDVVAIDGAPHTVEQLTVSTPSARGSASLYRFRFRNLTTRNKVDKTLKGDDVLDACQFEKRAVQFSYASGNALTFMDSEDYSEITLNEDDIAYERQFITEDMEGIQALVSDGRVLGLELPPVAVLEVVECDPSVRGASATARTKPATLSTGLIVQVPEYLARGETIRVDTRTAEFLSRA